MKRSDYLDPMTLSLLCMVSFTSLFLARGNLVALCQGLSIDAIALLFFMHGVKLPREAVIVGSAHWRLPLWIIGDIFAISPLPGRLFIWSRSLPMRQEMYKCITVFSLALSCRLTYSHPCIYVPGGRLMSQRGYAALRSWDESISRFLVSPVMKAWCAGRLGFNREDEISILFGD